MLWYSSDGHTWNLVQYKVEICQLKISGLHAEKNFAIGSLQQPEEWDTIRNDSNLKQKYLGFQKELYKTRHTPVIAV